MARITRGSVAHIRRLEPLWLSVHEHHSQSMPELAPYVSPEVTWRERSSLYKELFSKEDTFLLLAWNAGDLVGYALVHVAPTGSTWVADTWETADRLAELETLAVLPETAHLGGQPRRHPPSARVGHGGGRDIACRFGDRGTRRPGLAL